MNDRIALLDSDTLSEISRGRQNVINRASDYLAKHGRLTVSAISIFERLRGYRAAIGQGKPFQLQMRQFRAFASTLIILPVDELVADHAATIWSQLGTSHRKSMGDILIAATAAVSQLTLVTRNRKDFDPIARCDGITLTLADWTK